jgi:hypothetical protein
MKAIWGGWGLAVKERLPAPPLPFRHTSALAARIHQQEKPAFSFIEKSAFRIREKTRVRDWEKTDVPPVKKFVSELRKKVLDI